MKKLIALTAFGIALSLSSTSYATDFMSLYTKPVAKTEVKAEVKGTDVEGDHMSFYLSSKGQNTNTSIRAEGETNDDTTYIVFGVQIPRGQRG
jgi:hypothetical protein